MTDVAVGTERAGFDAAEGGAPPAHGQLVTVRNRPWVVTEVTRSTVSVEDDARDEELRVVWELEQGAVVHQQYELPSPTDGMDGPERLDARPPSRPPAGPAPRFRTTSSRPSCGPGGGA
ncbi:hypothetical protein ACFYQ5_33595 [Streptomyces sp. NPDC005794]|uniref:hypothetical protein n=1 Tax=Streptomyces sp. NPDC005794 TaxID=3364733 RepID=UPI0036A95196